MLIDVQNLSVNYRHNEFSKKAKTAVLDVSFSIQHGETVGLFGESGSGKSTIGHVLTGMIKPTKGKVLYENTAVSYPYRGELRRNVQLIFQHPEVSFNPKLPIIQSLRETYRTYVGADYSRQLHEDMEMFGIYNEHLDRFPNELSGGELQRLAIMRILSVRPKFLVLDEATSMLDAISQAQTLQILREYQKNNDVAYLFISHNHDLCSIFCQRILYLQDGKLTSEYTGGA